MPGGMSGLQILTAVRGTVPLVLKLSRFIGLSDTIDPTLCYHVFDLATELGSKMVAICSLDVLGALVGGNRHLTTQRGSSSFRSMKLGTSSFSLKDGMPIYRDFSIALFPVCHLSWQWGVRLMRRKPL